MPNYIEIARRRRAQALELLKSQENNIFVGRRRERPQVRYSLAA